MVLALDLVSKAAFSLNVNVSFTTGYDFPHVAALCFPVSSESQ